MTTPARIDDGYEFALHPPGCDDPLLSPWPRVHVLADWPIKDLDRVLEVKPVLAKFSSFLSSSHSNSIARDNTPNPGAEAQSGIEHIDDKIAAIVC